MTTRFAPSPTGRLHAGHAYAARFAWQRARGSPGGRFLVRLEDIDRGRCRAAFAEAILADLRTWGLDWDGPVRRQSEHLAEYQACLDTLDGRGLLYPCFCTRAEIALAAPHEGEYGPIYPGTCRRLDPAERQARRSAGLPHALRLDVGHAMRMITWPLRFHDETAGWVVADPASLGDVVLARKDSPCGYHLCATHDDAVQGVTLVTRGDDLLPATAVHVLLQRLMGWETPAYAHHPLVRDPQGQRLAKRAAH